ncbi:MAG: hypothetical protein ACI9LY_003920 [Arenicella sp.]
MLSNFNHYTAVDFTILVAVVFYAWIASAVTNSRNSISTNARPNNLVFHLVCSCLRQRLIVVLAALVVGMAFEALGETWEIL